MFHGIHGASDLRTYVSNSGAVLPNGEPVDLATEQVGFFRVDKTRRGLPDQAQLKPTARTSPIFKLGIGRNSYPAQDALQINEPKLPFLTREIKGKQIIGWRGTKADNQSATEIWTVGYDGVDARKKLYGNKDYHDLTIGIRLWGGPIKKLGLGRPWERFWFHVDKGCMDKCLDLCDTNPGLAQDLIADDILRQFNARKIGNIPLSRFVKATKLRKSVPADSPITGLLTATKYSLSLCDDGTNASLGAIQSQYPGFKVVRDSRSGAISSYSVWRESTAGAPAAFVNTQPVLLSVCDVCPSGYTLVAEQSVYSITRPVAPGTDLSTPAAQQTYANTIGTAYGTQSRGLATLTGNPGSGYTDGTHPLVFAGGAGTGAAGTVTVVGGVITARTITNKGINYTSAPTVTFPAAGAGTGGTVVATISAAPANTSTFVSASGGTATVTVSSTIAPTVPIGSDEIISSNVASAYCNPPAGSNVAWVAGITRTRAPKQWMITLADTICGESRLSELQTAYPDLVVSEQGTTGECARIYVTTNYSEPFEEEECTEASYIFYAPSSYLIEGDWKPFQTPLVDPVCEVEEVEEPCVTAGIKFETAAFVHHTGECLYGYYQYDVNDVDPVYMEINSHSHDFTLSPCDTTDQIVTKLQSVKFATGSGAFIRKAEESTLLQYGIRWSTHQGRNEAYGVSFAAKPEKWYDVYQLEVSRSEFQHGTTGKNGDDDSIIYAFAFPSGQGKAFESLVNGYILSLDNPELVPVIL